MIKNVDIQKMLSRQRKLKSEINYNNVEVFKPFKTPLENFKL